MLNAENFSLKMILRKPNSCRAIAKTDREVAVALEGPGNMKEALVL